MPSPQSAELPAESPEPSDRTPEYYKKRPCEELIGISAGIIGNMIVEAVRTGTEAVH